MYSILNTHIKMKEKKNQRYIFFHVTYSAVYPSRLFWCMLLSFGDISHLEVCLQSIKMALANKKTNKAQQQCIFTE